MGTVDTLIINAVFFTVKTDCDENSIEIRAFSGLRLGGGIAELF